MVKSRKALEAKERRIFQLKDPKVARLKRSRFTSVFELISAILPVLLTVFQSHSSRDEVAIVLRSTGIEGGVNVTIDQTNLKDRLSP